MAVESMYDAESVNAMQLRIAAMTAERKPLWGTMTAAQTMAHCRIGIEMGLGEFKPSRMLLGRILGPLIKQAALKAGVPMRKNSPTMKELVMGEGLNFETERDGLRAAVERFAAGPAECTSHPHAFFGSLTPEQWSMLMHKHLDHHLRQFGI